MLLTTLVFHQFFEGLSLGIWISTLPSGSHAYPIAITASIATVIFLPLPHKATISNIFLIQKQVNTIVTGSVEVQTAILT